MFRDRSEAGRMLGNALTSFRGTGALVLAIPGGGVPVGREVAVALDAELDIVVTRKIGAPGDPEFAIGSVTQDGETIADISLLDELNVSQGFLEEEAAREFEAVKRSLSRYRGDRPYPELRGRDVIIVDDGIATGSTMRAAITTVKRKGARSIVVAVPVGPQETIARLSRTADRVVCLMTPVNFFAVGDYYSSFEHVGGETVRSILDEASRVRGA